MNYLMDIKTSDLISKAFKTCPGIQIDFKIKNLNSYLRRPLFRQLYINGYLALTWSRCFHSSAHSLSVSL